MNDYPDTPKSYKLDKSYAYKQGFIDGYIAHAQMYGHLLEDVPFDMLDHGYKTTVWKLANRHTKMFCKESDLPWYRDISLRTQNTDHQSAQSASQN